MAVTLFGMTRGGPIKRTKDVRIRLTPDEWESWQAAREKSGRRELGAWVRAVVNELLTGQRAGRRPGDLPHAVVPEVNLEAFRVLRGVANNLNQLARHANAEGRLGDVAELRRLVVEVRGAAAELRGHSIPKPRRGQSEPGEGAVPGDGVQEPAPVGGWRRLIGRPR